MSDTITDLIVTYATRSHKELDALLLSKSKDDLIALVNNLVTIYMNDKNSSALRERVVVALAGYKHMPEKIGYNGFKQETRVGGKTFCEVKPVNIISGSKSATKRHNGHGNFTDYTFARFKKDISANLNMVVAGFIDGQLIFVLEFPFKHKTFMNELKRQLVKRFHGTRDNVGEFLRSASFSFKHYKDSKYLVVKYVNREALQQNKNRFTKDLYSYLMPHGRRAKATTK